jgi:hypothetical protein
MKLNCTLIRVDGGTQPRAKIDYAIVQEYREAMISGTIFPPVVVFNDGKSYWLADGFHRLMACNTGHIAEIEADIKQGTQRDAIKYSLGVNSSHGLRRTNEDKRRAVLRALDDDEWAAMSDRAIAEMCAVDHVTVGRIRAESTGEKHQSAERTGLDGRTINTTNIGKSKEKDPELERQIREGKEAIQEKLDKEASERVERIPLDDVMAMAKKMEDHYKKQADFMERIHVSSQGVDDPFMSAIVDYLGTLDDDQRRIEACYNIIKVCKGIANDLQVVK